LNKVKHGTLSKLIKKAIKIDMGESYGLSTEDLIADFKNAIVEYSLNSRSVYLKELKDEASTLGEKAVVVKKLSDIIVAETDRKKVNESNAKNARRTIMAAQRERKILQKNSSNNYEGKAQLENFVTSAKAFEKLLDKHLIIDDDNKEFKNFENWLRELNNDDLISVQKDLKIFASNNHEYVEFKMYNMVTNLLKVRMPENKI